MARFYPLYVRRSDGKAEVLNNKQKKEQNQPLPEQLDQKPDKNGVSDYYREVGVDETKHLDWRRKLGGMLASELGFQDTGMYNGKSRKSATDKPREKGYILAAFPENYRLFEHVKKSEGGDGKTAKSTKTHAGGGNDRQDAYLYGHPMGRKKRFRSPMEFYHHLLWLVTDEAGNPDNCACRICCPEELDEKDAPAFKKEVKKEVKKDIKTEQSLGVMETRPAIGRQPTVEITRKSSAQQSIKPQNPPQTPPVPPVARVNAPQQASKLPNQTKIDQQIDLRYDMFMYRQGELVWFQKDKQTWGLGVVLRRWKKSVTPMYSIQPLSHPFAQETAITVSGDQSCRPWLAWSVPNFSTSDLQNMAATYDSVDWNILFQNNERGNVAIDASILAAKSLDATFTPFELLSRTQTQQPGITESKWTGIYLGAEKLWLGDILRLRTPSNNEVLVLHTIVEHTHTSSFNNQVLKRELHLQGDVYTYKETPYQNLTQPIPPTPELKVLPPRMTEDLSRRNTFTIPAKGIASYWSFVSGGARYEIKDVKGRWYEATLLLPLVDPEYANSARKGDIREVNLLMNARGDCHNQGLHPTPVPEKRVQDRKDAVGRAAPVLALVDGMTPPSVQQQQHSTQGQAQSRQQQQQQQQQQPQVSGSITRQGESVGMNTGYGNGNGADGGAVPAGSSNNFDELMNLDDDIPGFGQEYGSQGSHGHPYY